MDKEANSAVIWEQLKAALDASGIAEKDKQGNYTVVVPAEYGYHSEFLLQPAYDYQRREDLMERMKESIDEMFFDDICTWENLILREACFDQDSMFYQEAMDVLLEKVSFVPEYEYFLNDEVCVNFLLGTEEELNGDFTDIKGSLEMLLKNQGYGMGDLKKTEADFQRMFLKSTSLDEKIDIFNHQHSEFLTSVCSELDNHVNSMGCLTVLAKMSYKDLAEFFQRDEHGSVIPKEIILPKETMVGIFNPWNGSGSLMEICLEKELTLSNQQIWDYQIEGAKVQGYTVKETYGFVDDAWKAPVSELNNAKNQLLDEPDFRTIL